MGKTINEQLKKEIASNLNARSNLLNRKNFGLIYYVNDNNLFINPDDKSKIYSGQTIDEVMVTFVDENSITLDRKLTTKKLDMKGFAYLSKKPGDFGDKLFLMAHSYFLENSDPELEFIRLGDIADFKLSNGIYLPNSKEHKEQITKHLKDYELSLIPR